MLMEEAGEVIKIAAKCHRFGFNSYHPEDPEKTENRELLRLELADVLAVLELMRDAHDIGAIPAPDVWRARERKLKFSRHQKG